MWSPLGPMPTHIIMTEMEKIVVKVSFDKPLLKAYTPYVDDT